MKFLPPGLLLLFILLVGIQLEKYGAEGGNILAVTMFGSKSMKNFYVPLLQALANKGHKITVVSPHKTIPSHPNIRDIVGTDYFKADSFLSSKLFKMRVSGYKPLIPIFVSLSKAMADICDSYYGMPEVKALLNEKFDLILQTYTFNECALGLTYRLDAPFILMHSNVPFEFNNAGGVPQPSSFVASPFFASGNSMNFFERVKNFIGVSTLCLADKFYRQAFFEEVYRKHLGDDIPGIDEISKDVSLIFSNSYVALNYPRPTMPDLIEVGGLHCRPAKPVEPKELNDFLTGSGKDGFIFFSMGSVLNSSTMPEEVRKVFVNAFSKLKQRVIWKWETEKMENLPPNVKLSKWLSQQDILGHPNIKMFISHGGLHSIEEAAYHGIPIIGIPMFGDQQPNMKLVESHGFAITLEITGLTEEKISRAINTILNDSSYEKNARHVGEIYSDRRLPPLEEATYWVEHVMRHKGAKHLRSGARDLNIFQYHSLDVVAFLISSTLIVLYLVGKITAIIFRKICGGKQRAKKTKKTQ